MLRVFGPGIFGVVLFCLWIYAILDAIATDESLTRNLPKTVWILLVIFVPTIGSLAWIGLGRPLNAGWAPGDTEVRTRRPPSRGPEDSGDWSRSSYPPAPRPSTPPTVQPRTTNDDDPRESPAARERRLAEWEAELRKREDDLGEESP